MKTKATIIIATVATLSAIGGAMLHFNNNSDSSTSVVSGSAQPTKPFTSAERASQGNPSSRNTAASRTAHRLVQVPREVSQRFLKAEENTIIEGYLPGKLTWSKDSLALLGLDEGQQTRLQEALDQASAQVLEVMKRTIKTIPIKEEGESTFELPDWAKKEGVASAKLTEILESQFLERERKERENDYTFEIPDWSKKEGAAIRAELTKALERELTKADAESLMKLANDKSGERLDSLFGEGQRKVTFTVANGNCRIMINVTKDDGSSRGSGFSIHDFSELPTEWMDLYKLPAEYQASVKASIKSQEESEREFEKFRNEANREFEEHKKQRNEAKRASEELRKRQEGNAPAEEAVGE